MMLNPNKTKALVINRSRTVNPLHGVFFLSGISICISCNLDILCVKFDLLSNFIPRMSWLQLMQMELFLSSWPFEVKVCGIVSCVSQIIGILRCMTCLSVSVPLWPHLCYFVLPILIYSNPSLFVLPILKCSPLWGSAAKCHIHLLEH